MTLLLPDEGVRVFFISSHVEESYGISAASIGCSLAAMLAFLIAVAIVFGILGGFGFTSTVPGSSTGLIFEKSGATGATEVGTAAPVSRFIRLIFLPATLLYWFTASVALTASLNSAIDLPLPSRIWKRSIGSFSPFAGVGSTLTLPSLSVPIAF